LPISFLTAYMNQDLLNVPFDGDLRAITRPFGVLLTFIECDGVP
jgi:hypothetical protein